jgi:hypothetical protein
MPALSPRLWSTSAITDATELFSQLINIPPEVASRSPNGRLDGALLRPPGQGSRAYLDGTRGLSRGGELVFHGSIVPCLPVIAPRS